MIPFIGPALEIVGKVIDRAFPDPVEREKAKAVLFEMQQRGELAQLEVNKAEAGHRSLWVAGWRPFIGWVCGSAFAWSFVLKPVAEFGAAVTGQELPPMPVLDLSNMMPVLLGMLGLGGLRTYEKINGVSR